MRKKKAVKRVLCLVLAASMVFTSVETGGLQKITNVKAVSVETSIDENKEITSADIKDPTIFTVLKVMVNHAKAKKKDDSIPALPEKADLTSSTYSVYANGAAFTFADLKAYVTEEIDLSVYGSKITTLSGLGFARGAKVINLTGLTQIVDIPEDEFAKCAMETIILPANVKKIGNRAFQQCTALKNVYQENGTQEADKENPIIDLRKIDEVGTSAFDGASALDHVMFKSYDAAKELKLGNNAFSNCIGLKSIDIPIKNADNLGQGAFSGCTELDNIVLEDELNYFPVSVFAQTKATYINMPSNITKIERSAFQESKLSNPDFTNCTKLDYIGVYAFAGTSSLLTINLPDGLTTIDDLAFTGSTILSCDIPDTVTKLGTKAFSLSTIAQVEISNALEIIEPSTFDGCELLSKVTIADAKTSKLMDIQKSAFANCYSLEDTSFLMELKNLTSIGDLAFAGCVGYVKNANGSIDSDCYNKHWAGKGLLEVTLPDCVKLLGEGVFSQNPTLIKADLGNGITIIPQKTFACESNKSSQLEKVIVPAELKIIEDSAFENCVRLNTIGYKNAAVSKIENHVAQFPDTLKHIGDRAFYGCGAIYNSGNLNQISGMQYKIGYVAKENIKSVQEAGTAAYLIVEKGEQEPRIVYINPEQISTTADEALEQIYIMGRRYYVDPDKFVSSAGEEDKEKEKVNIVRYFQVRNDEELSNVMIVPEKININSVNNMLTESLHEQPASEEEKEYYILLSSNFGINATTYTFKYIAFCSGLQKVILPDSIVDEKDENSAVTVYGIGKEAFRNCTNLTEVKLPDEISTIREFTFAGCGAQLYDWASGDFSKQLNRCNKIYRGLQKVILPSKLTMIEANAFKQCYNLDLIKNSEGFGALPSTLVSIGNSAFEECQSLTSVSIPSKTKVIGEKAFYKAAMQSVSESISISNGSVSTSASKVVPKEYNGNRTGLQKIDFSYAIDLEEIGKSAFGFTSLESVVLTNSKVKTLSASTFENAVYLQSLTCPENIESVAADVLKNIDGIKQVRVPASATLNKDIFVGGFEPWSRNTNLILTKKTEEISVPLGQEVILPIRAFQTDNVTGKLKVSIQRENEKDFTCIYGDGAVTSDMVEVQVDTATGGVYQFHIIGKEIEDKAKIKVEGTLCFPLYVNMDYYFISSQSLVFDIKTTKVPTTNILLKNENVIESESGTALYISKETASAEIVAQIEPANSTQDVTWECQGESNGAPIIELEDMGTADGVSKAKITPKALGTSTVTMRSGSIVKVIYVKVTAPAQSVTITSNSDLSMSGNKMDIGGSTKLDVNINYSNKYTDEEKTQFKDELIYSSSDEKVLTVDSNGNITAVGEGRATITVTAVGSNKKNSITVTVESGFVPDVNKLVILPEEGNMEVNVGENKVLQAKMYPSNAKETTLKWEVTSGSDKLKINAATGEITGVNPGNATVKVTSENGKSATKQIIVFQPAASVRFMESRISLMAGSSVSMTNYTTRTTTAGLKNGYRMSPMNTTDIVTWNTSNARVATVNNGTIKAIGKGTAVITVTTTSGKKASVTVSVVQGALSLSMRKKLTLNKGKTASLGLKKLPASSNDTITYKTSDVRVATVNAYGVVRAVGKGQCNITATSGSGRSVSCSVTVKIPSTKITLKTNTASTKKIYLVKGTSSNLYYNLSPLDTTDTVTFKSSSSKKVSVNPSTGQIQAKKKGSATITARTTSGKKAKIKVYVVKKAKKAKKIKKIKSASSVKRGKTIKLTAVLKVGSSTDTLSWSVDKTHLAHIDSYGYLTGVKKGKVKVTVTTSSGARKTKKIRVK